MITVDVYKYSQQWQKAFQVAYDHSMYELHFTLEGATPEEVIKKLAETMDVQVTIPEPAYCGAV